MPLLKIADVVFEVIPKYSSFFAFCKDYIYEGEEKPQFCYATTDEDIEAERSNELDYSDRYLETLAVYRKLCEHLIDNNSGIIFHCSAVAVDGKGYLFTAPSGTGKSTHARLWREYLGDRVVMVNDDKPIIRYVDGQFFVYGTPWQGKHNLGENIKVPIKALCEIKRSQTNFVERVEPLRMIGVTFNQTLRFEEQDRMEKLLGFLDKFLTDVELYRINCNTQVESAKVSFEEISK